MTYLFIAHDLSVVRFISDRIAVIYKGVIVEVAETEELFNNPVHPYTQALLSAVPIPDPILERKKVLKVYDPDQHDYETDKPSMVEIRPGHYVWANQAELARYKEALKNKQIRRGPNGLLIFNRKISLLLTCKRGLYCN